jgi:hypothetical protein
VHAAVRALVTAGLLVAAACAGAPPVEPVAAAPRTLEIRSSSVPFKLEDPQAREIGRLIWRGGISMTGKSRSFGGWSDLTISPDNRTLTSISDNGAWFSATVERDAGGNLTGLSGATIGPLHDLDGRPLANKEWADAEGMAAMADGSWLVSFERHHRIWRYPTLDGTPTAINLPPGFERQPNNGGVETLTVLAGGRIVAISEEYALRPNMAVGWIGTPIASSGGRYLWDVFEYRKIPAFNPTAIRALPDGSFVVLERAFDFLHGVRIRVMRFPASMLKADGVIEAEELARLASPYAVDNLEGVAATTGEHGETLLWMIADDNFNPLQRNLLLLFELAK